MNDVIHVDADRPVPAAARCATAAYPWRTIAVGESFLLRDGVIHRSAICMCGSAARSIGAGVRFRCAKDGERIRVWRIE
jgi:hypothetical protein